MRKTSEHYFFKLSDQRCETFLREWTQSRRRLQPEAANKMKEWLGEPGDNKLADWDISRDAPYFGFEIPGRARQILLRLAGCAGGLFRQLQELLRRRRADRD